MGPYLETFGIVTSWGGPEGSNYCHLVDKSQEMHRKAPPANKELLSPIWLSHLVEKPCHRFLLCRSFLIHDEFGAHAGVCHAEDPQSRMAENPRRPSTAREPRDGPSLFLPTWCPISFFLSFFPCPLVSLLFSILFFLFALKRLHLESASQFNLPKLQNYPVKEVVCPYSTTGQNQSSQKYKSSVKGHPSS